LDKPREKRLYRREARQPWNAIRTSRHTRSGRAVPELKGAVLPECLEERRKEKGTTVMATNPPV
jgi:hypothetical protein